MFRASRNGPAVPAAIAALDVAVTVRQQHTATTATPDTRVTVELLTGQMLPAEFLTLR